MSDERKIPLQYECGKCGGIHEWEDDAQICCRPSVNRVYVCPECEDTHTTESEARACCPNPDAVPGELARGPMGVELEAQGQMRLGYL